MSLARMIFYMIQVLFYGILGLLLLMLAISALFTGGFTEFVLYTVLHVIYGHTVLVKHAEIMRKVASRD